MKYITQLSQSEEDVGPNQISKTKLAQARVELYPPQAIWLGPIIIILLLLLLLLLSLLFLFI